MNKEKLMIIDGNSILNRAFYGLQGPRLLSTKDGIITNAVFGFLNILFKYIEEEKPDMLCVAFDLKAPTFRHIEFEDYKAKRKGMPKELADQVPIIKEVLDAMNVKRIEIEGYEADDILGTISLIAEKEGKDVIIITGDRDSLQLSSDTTRVKIPVTKGGRTETEEYDRNAIFEKYGIEPVQLIDVKGLMGDASDNIPGVPGIGEKTGFELIKTFHSIENLYENIESVAKKGVRTKLEENKELAFKCKHLAAIHRSIPDIEGLEGMERQDYGGEKLLNLFTRLEFKSFIEKLNLNNIKDIEKKQKEDENLDVFHIEDREGLNDVKASIRSSGAVSIYYMADKTGSFYTTLFGLALTWRENQAAFICLNENFHEQTILDEFKEILEDADIKKYGHDLKNLIVYLKGKGISIKGIAFDTMIAAYVVDPSRDTYTVSELAKEYLDKNLDPIENLIGKGRTFTPFASMKTEDLMMCSSGHSETIFKVKHKLDEVLKEHGQSCLFNELELPLVEVLAEMEHWGFKVNRGELERYSDELDEKIDLLVKDIYAFAGEEFNINSPKQLGVILFEKMGMPVIKKTKTGYSTDAEVLEQLSENSEFASKIIEYRQLIKLKTTYAQGLLAVINPDTGKIHSNFKQTVAATGRISSTEPNLQNIPIKLEMGRNIRRVFVPSDENFILADADYSQIELRVLAHISNDENMIEAFKNNEDIHTTTAAKIFGIEKEQVTPAMRSGAKAVNFGIVYGIGDFSLSKDLGITRKEARRYIDEYLNKYQGVKKYMHDIVEEGKKQGYVTTLFNRRRYLPEIKSSNYNIRSFGERIAMNTPIQGSAADIIKIAMVQVYKALKENNMKSRLILQVHDELIIEAHKNEKDKVIDILKDSMENAAKLSVPLFVEVKTGSNWFETK